MLTNTYSYYSKIELPISNIRELYFNYLSMTRYTRGRVIFRGVDYNYNGDVALCIPEVVLIFCFRDWFHTRVDLEVSFRALHGMANKFELDLTRYADEFIADGRNIVDVDFNKIFLDVETRRMRMRKNIQKEFFRGVI